MLTTDYLKQNTAIYHDKIESKLESKKIFNGNFSEKEYFKMLQVNHIFLKFYENMIKNLLTKNDFETLSHVNFEKLELIEKDLHELSIQELELQKLFELESRAEAFGALYVIEGSMLGGNVIAKTLKKKYPSLEAKKFNYFGHYTDDLGKKWKKFLSYINNEFTTDEQKKEILIGAKKAYKDIINFA